MRFLVISCVVLQIVCIYGVFVSKIGVDDSERYVVNIQ